jgi:hypothetical protein
MHSSQVIGNIAVASIYLYFGYILMVVTIALLQFPTTETTVLDPGQHQTYVNLTPVVEQVKGLVAAPVENIEIEIEEPETELVDYWKLTKVQLHQLCRERGLPRKSAHSKSQLIELLV